MAKSLKGFVANPIELNTYGFYGLYRYRLSDNVSDKRRTW